MWARMKHFFTLCIIPALLSGCATFVDMNYRSTTSPDYAVYTTSRVFVRPDSGANGHNSSYYLKHVVQALRTRGLKNAQKIQSSIYKDSRDFQLRYSLATDTSYYEYQSADYGVVGDGTYSGSCSSFDGFTNCSASENQTVGITGYSTRGGSNTIYRMDFSLGSYDEGMGAFYEVMEGSIYSDDTSCSEKGMYRLLIEEFGKRVSFTEPRQYDISVKIPSEQTCDY